MTKTPNYLKELDKKYLDLTRSVRFNLERLSHLEELSSRKQKREMIQSLTNSLQDLMILSADLLLTIERARKSDETLSREWYLKGHSKVNFTHNGIRLEVRPSCQMMMSVELDQEDSRA